MEKLVIAGHITEVYGPVQALRDYLISRGLDFLYISHPFSYCSIPYSRLEIYSSGVLKMAKEFRYGKFPQYIRDVFLNIYWIIRYAKGSAIFIGIDNLNALCGVALKKLGGVKKVIYYVIDYTPKRFNNRFMNFLYHSADRLCVRGADFIWNISPRIAKVREKQGVRKEKNLIVPVGVDLDRIQQIPLDKVNRKKLVFVSHLVESKGCQLLLEAMHELVKDIGDVRLEIIGTGPYEETLRAIAHNYDLDRHVLFLGPMEHGRLLEYLPSCGIALAPYVDSPYSITYYADATKPKEYIACGLPIVITNVANISEEVEKNKLGVVINYDKEELIRAVKRLVLDSAFYISCRRNAFEYSRQWQWKDIYDKAFKNVCSQAEPAATRCVV